jgi:hypothetical protein
MNALRALAYADWRALVNDVRRGFRSPLRLIVWAVYGGSLILFFVSRTVFARTHAAGDTFGDASRADYLICGQVIAAALALAFGAGRVGFFRTLAEARFVIGSSVRAPIALTYLQARHSVSTALRFLSSMFYLAFVAAPRHLAPLTIVTDVLIVGALFSATSAIAMTRKLATDPWPVVCRVLGLLLLAFALVPIVRDLSYQLPIPAALAARIRDFSPAVHPGLVLFVPNVLWLAVPLVVFAIAVLALALGGRDRYPELYALSLSRIDGTTLRAERRKQRTAAKLKRPARAVHIPAPPGSPVILWKSIVAFRRGVTLRYVALGAAGWIGVGFAVAHVAAAWGHELVGAFSSLAVSALFALTMLSAKSVARELKRPLFWLCDISLFERLGMLVLAQNWRKLLTLEALTVGIAVGGGPPLVLYGTGILLPLLIMLVGTIGLAGYALVPSAGSAVFARFAISIALLIPVAVSAAVAVAILGTTLAAAAVALFLISESIALVGLATWRIDGRVDQLVA